MMSSLMSSPPITISHRLFNSRDVVASSHSFFRPPSPRQGALESLPAGYFLAQDCIPCQDFGEFRFPASGAQIPYSVKKFFVFPNTAIYFGQTVDPENIL